MEANSECNRIEYCQLPTQKIWLFLDIILQTSIHIEAVLPPSFEDIVSALAKHDSIKIYLEQKPISYSAVIPFVKI